MPLEVGNTDISGFVARANPPLTLHGSVTVENAARDVDLASIGVNLRNVDSGMTLASARAAADGTFSLENVPPGRYFADVLPGASGAYVQSITVGGEEVRGARVRSVGSVPGSEDLPSGRFCHAPGDGRFAER